MNEEYLRVQPNFISPSIYAYQLPKRNNRFEILPNSFQTNLLYKNYFDNFNLIYILTFKQLIGGKCFLKVINFYIIMYFSDYINILLPLFLVFA